MIQRSLPGRSTPLLLVALLATATLPVGAAAQKFQGLALTPPMGWNSWNRFGCDVNEKVVREAADALVSTGMRDAGYRYVVIDDCWQVGRAADGTILADSVKFPSGMKALADYVHSKGLKFGLYSDAGKMTCALRPGSLGHEYQDARTYASWGVDYLKYDWCHTSTQDAQASYTLMRDALYAAGRPVVFSICEWGLSQPWTWAADVAHLWRTTGDITNSWAIPDGKRGKTWGGGVSILLEMQKELHPYAGPDHWNDPDMLEIGNGVLTPDESRSHFSLWAMLAAPLIAGNDLANMDATTRSILLNREVIAVDQDSLGKQGWHVKLPGTTPNDAGFEVWMRELSGGDYAVALFNRGERPLPVVFDWSHLPLPGGEYAIRDLWKHASVGTTAAPYRTSLPRHATAMLRLSPRR